MLAVWPGQPYPLGATYDGVGVNFALFSEVATKVELCLFDANGRETRFELTEVTGFVRHGYVASVGPAQLYGFRVHGPYEPEEGLRCNPSKLLADPYARAISGGIRWHDAVFPYRPGSPREDLAAQNSDSRPYVPRSVVTNPYFEWANDRHPATPWNETVVYETHVKGFTARHPEIPPESRGKFAGLSHPAAVEHLQRLGVTAVELLPVHQFIHDRTLVDRGLHNYWGYNSISYFAPHNEYSSAGSEGQQVQEFKNMVKTLHAAGIEVLLDVVYNHTGEGNHLGPMLSLRGIDNPAYYRLDQENPRFYTDYTGTGNTLNMRHPNVLQLIMDSLRYWVTEMHVDGFRFDLASTLARGLHDVDRLSAFFDLIQQDPIVSRVKLIAEPWDIGEGGYQVGNFPPLWSEWNGKYRDTVRDYWRGADQTLSEFAYRLTGSSDLYSNNRRPHASINFITAHDGFTLADLVSYNDKHNDANGEGNRDGHNDNRSWNCGVEGPSQKPDIVTCRRRQQRNLLTTLLLSQGVPMILGGDELGRTQSGNNNAYCQDNETSWFDWENVDRDLLTFTRHLLELRREHPVFRRRGWFLGKPIRGSDLSDISWFKPDGEEMSEEDWQKSYARSIGVFLNGHGIRTPDLRGQVVVDDSFYLLLNAHHESMAFTLPQRDWGREWVCVVDTSVVETREGEEVLRAKDQVAVEGRALKLLRRVDQDGPDWPSTAVDFFSRPQREGERRSERNDRRRGAVEEPRPKARVTSRGPALRTARRGRVRARG